MATLAVLAELKDGAARKITFEMLAEARRLSDASGGGTVGLIALGALGPGRTGPPGVVAAVVARAVDAGRIGGGATLGD